VSALALRNAIEADAILPIPLSPEKAVAGEIHRTKLLSAALGRLLQVPVLDGLELTAPKGKRAATQAGQSPAAFRGDYSSLLTVPVEKLQGLKRIILVDDVCTFGNTFAATITALRRAGISADVVAASAGQMTVRDAVRVDRAVLKV